MKILSIVGARPQFIKAAMICRAFEKTPAVEHALVHTGQHFDDNMSRIFFEQMRIPKPRVNLGIHGSTHGKVAGTMMIEIEKVLLEEKPDKVIVYGDTDSTLAGALAAAKLGVFLGHVEAGLRSFNRSMPEEINRIVADAVSDALFAPTTTAVLNLQRENKPHDAIHFSGDVMFDASLAALEGIDENAVLGKHGLRKGGYNVATLHRANNTDCPERLLSWFKGLNIIGESDTVLLPLHPRTLKALVNAGNAATTFPRIQFIEPVGYSEMAVLTRNSRLVITDSGGLQKEAYFHKVPCLILRDETEWTELLDTTWSRLVHCSVESLVESTRTFRPSKPWQKGIFGEGKTAEFIANVLT